MVGLAGRKISRYSAVAGLCVSLALIGLLVACGGSTTPVAISVSPAGATVFASGLTGSNWPPQTATFTATVTNTNNTGVSWAVTTTNGGSITSAGVYTAPTVAVGLPGSATIVATSTADSTKTASATVTITPTTVPTSVIGSPYSIMVTATEGPTVVNSSAFNLTVQ
jgi:predicted secreted protein